MSILHKNTTNQPKFREAPTPGLFLTLFLTSLYLSIVFYLTLFASLSYIFLFPLIFLSVFLCLKIIAEHLFVTSVLTEPEASKISPYMFFIITGFVIFAGQMLYWGAYYPGGFNLDALGQWDQSHGNMHLNNWHPVFTTGLYYLITQISDSFAFCIFTQLLIFTLSAAYLLTVLFKLHISLPALIGIAIYIGFSPSIALNNICLYKDAIFSIAIIFLMIYTIKIVATDGQWILSFPHIFLLAFNLLAVTLIRHNGIFYTIPLMICLVFFFRKAFIQILSSLLLFLLTFTIIQGPVFQILSVDEHSNFVGESVGIPMAIMANAYVNDYENTPDDVKCFMREIAPYEEWETHYIPGEWDSCKWEFGGIELFEQESLSNIVKLGLKTVVSCPETTYTSVKNNARVVWQVFGNVYWDTWVYIEPNDYGIHPAPNEACKKVVDKLLSFSLSPAVNFLFWSVGATMVIDFLIILFAVSRREYWKIIYALPPITYNFLTMLLLCGPSHRYFYFNSIITLPILLLSMNQQQTFSKDE